MSLPAVVRVELTPETRRLLLRLIEAVEGLGGRPSSVFAESHPLPGVEISNPRRCARCRIVLLSGKDDLCANCEQGSE